MQEPFSCCSLLAAHHPLEGLLNVLNADFQKYVYVDTTHHTKIELYAVHAHAVSGAPAGLAAWKRQLRPEPQTQSYTAPTLTLVLPSAVALLSVRPTVTSSMQGAGGAMVTST